MISKHPLLTIIIVLHLSVSANAQLLFNGNFALGTAFWGCGAETNNVTLYGGTGTNDVAEVDAAAGLCQSVTGLTIGQIYSVSYRASRRLGGCPSPAITNMYVSVGGITLGTSVRTNTLFSLSLEGFIFIATATSHNISFSPGPGFGGSTCGMILDDIAVAASPLPIELSSFDTRTHDQSVELTWSTASEKNNSYFEIERSANGSDFETIANLPSLAPLGNSSIRLDYHFHDPQPNRGVNYYRLRQTDHDGTHSTSSIVTANFKGTEQVRLEIFPNPAHDRFSISLQGSNSKKIEVKLINSVGKAIYSEIHNLDEANNTAEIRLPEGLPRGYYQCVVNVNGIVHYQKLMVN